jgi:hypothetical protein
MTDEERKAPVWERLDSLSDHELNALISAAANVLTEGADPSAQDAVGMPPGPAARAIRSELEGVGVEIDDAEAERFVSDDAVSREVALATLRELAKDPELASEIEDAWRARGGMMIIDAGILSGGALLLLVMKLKHVKVKKGEADVEFYEVKSGVLGAIRRFLGH